MQNSTSEADSYSLVQEISRAIYSPEVVSLLCSQQLAQLWARWIWSTHSYCISLSYILILSTYILSCSFTSGLLTKLSMHFSSLSCMLHVPPMPYSLTYSNNILWRSRTWSSSSCTFQDALRNLVFPTASSVVTSPMCVILWGWQTKFHTHTNQKVQLRPS